MNPTKTIFLSILLSLTAQAGWKPLKTLGHYAPRDFSLKKGVVYVEIRKRTSSSCRDPKGKIKTKHKTSLIQRIYAISPASKRVFSKLPMKKKFAFRKRDYYGMICSYGWYHNGFMQGSAGKLWRLENARDVVEMVKPVDTEADLSLVLWSHYNHEDIADKYSAKYRKSGKGYEAREHYVVHENAYGCGDFTYRYKISRSGKILQKKLLSKRETWCGGE